MGKPTIWSSNRSDTNRAVQPQKTARGLKIGFKKKRECTIHAAKTKVLISFAVTLFVKPKMYSYYVTHNLSPPPPKKKKKKKNGSRITKRVKQYNRFFFVVIKRILFSQNDVSKS